jgi:hypothetical protein
MVANISLYRRLGYQEMERRTEAGFRRVFMRKLLGPVADGDNSTTSSASRREPSTRRGRGFTLETTG